MTVAIYGIPRSRAIRNLWMAAELGLEHERVDIGFGPEGTRSAAYLEVNPNGQIPALRDGDLILWESLAINLYLAKREGGPLAPATLSEDGLMTMWSFWAATALEPHGIQIMYHSFVYPEAERDPKVLAHHLAAAVAPLDVLEAHLARHGHLVGGRFTVADLNVACVVFYLRFAPDLIAARPALAAWQAAAMARPAARAAFALRGD